MHFRANSFAQMGAIAGLLEDLAPTYAMRDTFLKRQDMMYDALREIEGLEVNLPDGAFYPDPGFPRPQDPKRRGDQQYQ